MAEEVDRRPYINEITEGGATNREMYNIVYRGRAKYFYRSTGGGNPRFGNAYQGVFVPVYGMLNNGELVKVQTLLDINRIHGGNQERKWLIKPMYMEYSMSTEWNEIYKFINKYILFEEDLFISYVNSMGSPFWANDARRTVMNNLLNTYYRNNPVIEEATIVNDFPIEIPYIRIGMIKNELIRIGRLLFAQRQHRRSPDVRAQHRTVVAERKRLKEEEKEEEEGNLRRSKRLKRPMVRGGATTTKLGRNKRKNNKRKATKKKYGKRRKNKRKTHKRKNYSRKRAVIV